MMSIREIENVPPAALFQGFDTFMTAGRNTAVRGKAVTTGASSQTYYKVCSDIESLQQALQISGSVSASFGFGGASAKASFVDQLGMTATSVVVVVYTNVILGAQLTPNVKLLHAPPADLNTFFQAYGDSFVNSITMGAEYFATYVFYAETREEQLSVEATLEANGILTSGTLGATLQTSLTETQQSVNTRQSLQQLMTGYTSRAYPDSGDIITFALNFATVKPDAPTVVDYGTEGYENVPGMPAGFQSIANNRNLYAGIGTQPGLAGQYAQLVAAQNAATALAQIYETYGYTGDTVLPTRSAQIGTDISALETLFYAIDENPTGTFSVPSLPSLAWGQPALNATIGTVGPFGGPAGAPFADVNLTSVLNMVTLQQFVASGQSWIVSIDSTYSSTNEGSFILTHGGTGGPASPALHLAAGEFVTSVSGTYGFVDASDVFVISLEIGTSATQSFAWPPTPVISDEPFTWTASSSTVFLGFGGAAGTALNQLSLITVTFAPASWSAPSAS